jgi:DNA-binding transcriptional regulator YhcF (GntR family)
MANQAPGSVATRLKARTQALSLLKGLARLHEDQAGYASPMIGELSSSLGVCNRTIQRYLKWLEQAGEITIDRASGRSLRSRYYVMVNHPQPTRSRPMTQESSPAASAR